MQSGILMHILSLFNQQATWKMADQLGENKGDLNNALEQIIPVILRGFSSKAAEGDNAASHLLAMAADANDSGWWQQVVNQLEGTDNAARSMELLKTIFGHNNVQRIADSIAAHNHIKPSSARTLMQWVAPACLGALGNYAATHNLNAGSLAASLSKLDIELDNTAPQKNNNNSYDAGSTSDAEPQKKAGSMRIFWPLLLLLLAFAAWWFLKTRNDKVENITATADTTFEPAADTVTAEMPAATTAAATPAFTLNADSTLTYALGDTITLKLPGGSEMHVPANGAEAMLMYQIQESLKNGIDTSEEGKKAAWVNLYNVQFSKMLNYREGAVQQIRNIATILKAYPAVTIKLGGYTDNTGAADVNKKLSQQRAEKVAASLNTAGAGAQVEKAEGYGADFPVADNTTPVGRAQNRRVSCRIVSVKK